MNTNGIISVFPFTGFTLFLMIKHVELCEWREKLMGQGLAFQSKGTIINRLPK